MDLKAPRSLEEAIKKARLPELQQGELKWMKVSSAQLPAHKRVIDLLFDGVFQVVPLCYHSIIIDMQKVSDKLYRDGSREAGFNKEVFSARSKIRRPVSRQAVPCLPWLLKHVFTD